MQMKKTQQVLKTEEWASEKNLEYLHHQTQDEKQMEAIAMIVNNLVPVKMTIPRRPL